MSHMRAIFTFSLLLLFFSVNRLLSRDADDDDEFLQTIMKTKDYNIFSCCLFHPAILKLCHIATALPPREKEKLLLFKL
jgi:hypothetical protein